jgi:hypothetical protein
MLEMVLEGRGPLHRRLEVRGSDELLAVLRERLGEWTAGDMGSVAYGEPAGQDGMVLRGGYGVSGGSDGHAGLGGYGDSAGQGWVWVHRLTVRTAPELELDRLAGEDSFAGEAVRLARRLAADPEGREALLKEALEPMMRNPRLRRLLENRVPVSAEILLERAAARLAGLLEREEA